MSIKSASLAFCNFLREVFREKLLKDNHAYFTEPQAIYL